MSLQNRIQTIATKKKEKITTVVKHTVVNDAFNDVFLKTAKA